MTEYAPTANLTLDERQQFEKLLAEYANAEMDVVRSSGRRHNAMHACLDFINKRTTTLVREAANAGIDLGKSFADGTYKNRRDDVPTGTMRADKLEPIAQEFLDIGGKHLPGIEGLPVYQCACVTCCERRALDGIARKHTGSLQTDIHCTDEACWCRQPAPILDTSGGN